MKYQIDEISKQIRIEKTIKKIFKTILLAFLITLLTINLIMLYQTNIRKEEIPRIGNISVFNIISESMVPTINVNDLIVIKKCTQEEIKNGDIITYKRENGSIITHRIININQQNTENIYTTKGDNNPIQDEEPIKHSQVYGKYLFKINSVGKFVENLQKNNGLISVGIAILIFVMLKNSNDKKKENRKRTREKYDIKKKRDEYSRNSRN